MSLIEIVATVFGVACVWLTIRRSIWCWPTGLVMVTLYIIVFYRARLYSDMGLQVVYVFLQLYGWAYWAHGARRQGRIVVERITRTGTMLAATLAIAGTGALGYSMDRYTDADLAYWDASTTVLSLIAQFLMGRRVLESWLVWIAVDALAIGIYGVKGLHLTQGLYALFLMLAGTGFLAWQRSWKLRLAPAAA